MLTRFKDWARPLFVDRTLRGWIIASAILNLLSWVLILVRLGPLILAGKIISLHYSIYLGINSVGPAILSLLIPALGTVTVVANTLLARGAYTRNRFSALVFLSLTCFIELVALAACGYLILINLRT